MPKMKPPPTLTEVLKFRAWAQEHYTPLSPIADYWHDTVKDECLRINMAQCRDILVEEELTEAIEPEAFDLQQVKRSSYPPPRQSGAYQTASATAILASMPSDHSPFGESRSASHRVFDAILNMRLR